MTTFNAWPVLLVLSKLLLYVAASCTLGGIWTTALSHRLPKLQAFCQKCILFGCIVGLIAASAHFFIQVGQFSETGLVGMGDRFIIALLWDSAAGKGWGQQMAMWLLIGICSALGSYRYKWLLALFLAIGLILGMTFTGHSADLPYWVSLVLALHLAVAFGWMGALIPLWYSCRHVDNHSLQQLMVRFGNSACALVPLLLVAGIVIAYKLTLSVSALVSTAHGQLLLVKVVGVSALLLLAARHKLKLVPRLHQADTVPRLRQSITLEIGVGCAVLVITSIITTTLTPSIMQ